MVSRYLTDNAVANFLNDINLPSFLTDNPIYKNRNARTLLFTIGAGYALCKALCFGKFLLSFFTFKRDISERYGKGTWAVITGATEGIGKAFAFELARQGFHIVLVGRNLEKLKKTEAELHEYHPRVQTRMVCSDFTRSYEEGFAESILEQVQSLDVSILINNAGIYASDYFYRIPIKTIRDMILINGLAHALIIKAFLPKFENRLGRSAIINVASLAASSPKPFEQTYASTKVFHDYLSRGLAYECPKIDIISMKPGPVSTNMNNYAPKSMNRITAEEFVTSTLSYLGCSKSTHGHWKHRFDHFVMDSLLPDCMKLNYFKRRFNVEG